jgi:NADH dehydrogenase
MTTTLPTTESTGASAEGDTGLDVVTGAFSYSGRAIAAALVDSGRRVRTMTGHPGRAPAGTALEVRPLDFDDQLGLVASLEGVTTLYNTYWVRFAHGRVDHELAIANSRALFQAAARARVQRIVHVSITHPSLDSPSPYFRGKALVERALAEANVSYAVLRPAILFGGDGVLLNNIAWLLRHLPVFAVDRVGRHWDGRDLQWHVQLARGAFRRQLGGSRGPDAVRTIHIPKLTTRCDQGEWRKSPSQLRNINPAHVQR